MGNNQNNKLSKSRATINIKKPKIAKRAQCQSLKSDNLIKSIFLRLPFLLKVSQ